MDGSFLRFYVHENDRLHGQLAWEWLLAQANQLGIRGGTAFRAMAGFGRRRMLHEERFFELAGSVTVEVEFIVTDDEARQVLELVSRQGLRFFYARMPAHFGVIGGESGD
jgi:PII-like signaling protein